jgi:3-oxoacyl-[acyl-carrier-protein] synthase-3
MALARIIGTGSALPEKVITNRDLERMVETSDEWITTRSGIKERRVIVSETVSSLSAEAGMAALESAGLLPDDIDLIVTGTVTPDYSFPSTSCFVQSALNIRPGTPAFDLSAACSGFVFALDAAKRYVETGGAKNALVIGADAFSRIIDWKDRSTCVLFGDGAGAVVLSESNGASGVLSSVVHSDGRYWGTLYAASPNAPSPFETRALESQYVKMNGNETFKVAVKTIVEVCKEAVSASGVSMEDVTLMIPHQANVRIISASAERLGLDETRVLINIDKYGNTSAGSIPIALDEAVRARRVKEGDVVLFVAFGGGLTWGATVIRW